MTERQLQIKRACIEWMIQNQGVFSHAVTLTLKSYRRLPNDLGHAVEELTDLEAKRSLRYFTVRLNIALFGKAAKRFGRSIAIIPALEGQGINKRLHYHCAIGGLPDHLSMDAFKEKILDAWIRTPFGYNEIEVKPLVSINWLTYMGKEIGLKNADVLDWENVVIPSASTSLV